MKRLSTTPAAPHLDDRLYPEAIQRASDTVTPVIQSDTPEAAHSDAPTPQ